SASAQFTVTTPIISLNPTSGPTGTTINISGNNFIANSVVTISYDNAGIATTPTAITATSTGAITGSITVPSSSSAGGHTVKATDGSSNSASASFTVTIPATTSKLTISSQDRVGNTITGYYTALIQSGKTIASGFTPVTFTLNSNQQYFVEPTNYGVYVFDHWQDTGLPDNPRSISISTATQLIAVYRTTAISLSPSTGPAGTTVTVSGNHFSANSAITISFDGTTVTTNLGIVTDSTGSFSGATFSVPTSSTAGSHLVRVSDGNGGHAYSDSFIVGPSAVISISPTSGNVGVAVKVTGTNFARFSKVSVYFDGTIESDSRAGGIFGAISVNPAIVETDSAGGFAADIEVPYTAAGAHTVKATDQSNSDTKGFTVTPGSLLLHPLTGHVGTKVNFHASGFAANSAITISFDGTQVTTNPNTITSSSDAEFPGSFTVPTTGIGSHTILISDSAGNAYSSTFTVTDPSTPVFNAQNIVTGLSGTDGMAFIPDNGPNTEGSGAFMVIQKSGAVIVVKNIAGTFVKQSVPFVTVPNLQVLAESGLLGIAIDPNWVTTKMVYFYLTVSVNGVLQNQVVRYTATTDSSGNIVADTTKGQQLIIG
ncbi:MAG TPA: PQQ-dependent sugar dehydrogenase, partial [Ktedonobacteraceae bacterium]|nr:PQQ-dependent sugar dehydrogenase [Ktedonobacteraceae bacterium]